MCALSAMTLSDKATDFIDDAYLTHLIRSTPADHVRVREIIARLDYTLRGWLKATIISMGFVAIVTWLGLVLIGASLGGITALAAEFIARVIDKGVLVVKSGSREGNEARIVERARLGSYDGCEVYLPGGQGVAQEHAIVLKRPDGFLITPSPRAGGATTLVNQRLIPPAGQKLNDGDTITVGNISVVFQAR